MNEAFTPFNTQLDKSGNVWFKGKDVVEILEYRNTMDTIIKHAEEEDKKDSCNVSDIAKRDVSLTLKRAS